MNLENNGVPPTRLVFCEDAIAWLQQTDVNDDYSFVASLPDISEFQHYSLEDWRRWFMETARLIMQKTPDNGVCVFYQSDIKYEGTWVDKAYMCQKVAEECGLALLWHKIICRIEPGRISFGRPSYSHILAFSKNVRCHDLKNSTSDVIPEMGDKTWERGMGLPATKMIAEFIKNQTSTQTVVQPFCGQGAMLAMANGLGLSAIGIERSHKRAEVARHLKVSSDLKHFLK